MKINDLVIEKNPYGFEMETLVCENPKLENNIWTVKTVARNLEYFKYRQKNKDTIVNRNDQETELVYSPRN